MLLKCFLCLIRKLSLRSKKKQPEIPITLPTLNYPVTLFQILKQIYANFYLIMQIYVNFYLIMQIYAIFFLIMLIY